MTSVIEERRQHTRVATSILIRYRDADQFFSDYIQNISCGGIFVATSHPLPLGTQLSINFSLPDCDRLIETSGVVVRATAGGSDTDQEPSGMGIKFEELDQEALGLIDTFVSRRLNG